MKSCPAFKALINVGLKTGTTEPFTYHFDTALKVCEDYCVEVGLGLTFTPTRFVYVGGGEPGVIVGLINYPRFPKEEAEIRSHAFVLAERLRVTLKQWRVSIEFPDETVMIGDQEADYAA